MKKLSLIFLCCSLLSCSPHKKILYFEGETREGGLNLPFNTKDDPLSIRLCLDSNISKNRIEFKKRTTGYALDVSEIFDNVDCLQKLRIDGLWGIKRVDKLYFGEWKILDTINFKPKHPALKLDEKKLIRK